MAPTPAKFTTEELDFLVQFLESKPQLKFIITSDTTTKLDKEAAWERITEAFNCASLEEFSAAELRSKWNYSKHRLLGKCYKLRAKKDVWLDKLSDNEKRLLALTGSKFAQKVKIKAVKPFQESPISALKKRTFSLDNDRKDSSMTVVDIDSSSEDTPIKKLIDSKTEGHPFPYIVSTSSMKDEVKGARSGSTPTGKTLAEDKDPTLPFVIVSRMETNSNCVPKENSKKKKPAGPKKFPPIKLKGPLKGNKPAKKTNAANLGNSGHSPDLLSHLKAMNDHLSKLVSTNRETLKCLKSLDQKQDKIITLLAAALNVDDV